MHSSVEQIQILYEIAMSIGTSLDLRQMLRKSLSALLKKLNCSAGGVYFLKKDNEQNLHLEKIHTIPRTTDGNKAYQVALQHLQPLTTVEQWATTYNQKLPISGQTGFGSYFHILELPDVGLMILIKNGKDLDPFVIKSLKPLMLKLADACKACLQNKALEEAHDNAITINLQLTQKSLELKKSRNELHNILLELRRVVNRNQAILDAIPDLMFYLNRAGDILDYKVMSNNNLPPEMAEEVTIGQNLREMLPSDIVDSTLHHINQTLDSNTMQVFEYQLPGRQGARDFEARLVVSGPDEVLAIVRNITKRKQAEEALRDSEERLRATISSMDDMIFVFDKNGIILDFYQSVQQDKLLYVPPEHFLGKSFQEVLSPHLIELLEDAISVVVDTDTVQQFEYSLIVGEVGKEVWFEARVSMRQDSFGEFAGVTIVVRDITTQHELDGMRDNFVSTVTHELKTPLASIMGWTETLLGERPGLLNDTQRRFLCIIEESSERLDKLIEELLMVSHLQHGTLRFDMYPFSPCQTIEKIQNMMVPLADKKSIALEIFNEWPPEEQLTGDRARLEQVIINLIGNAIKFTPVGGQICVRSTQEKDGWYFEVQDTGIGIPNIDISRLFQRFFRAGNATESQIQGTGLGLYICKAYVEGHGGQISLESEVDQGTTLWFTLPQS